LERAPSDVSSVTFVRRSYRLGSGWLMD
jgi:hypothetical protein